MTSASDLSTRPSAHRATISDSPAQAASTSPRPASWWNGLSFSRGCGPSSNVHGPMPATTIARTTAPGSAAADATAYGPPPEIPTTDQAGISSSSRTALPSAPTDARPGGTVGAEPYPGRLNEISRTSAAAAASWTCSACNRPEGVPEGNSPTVGQDHRGIHTGQDLHCDRP